MSYKTEALFITASTVSIYTVSIYTVKQNKQIQVIETDIEDIKYYVVEQVIQIPQYS